MAKTDTKTTNKNDSDISKLIDENSKLTLTIAWEEVAPAYEATKTKVAKTLKAPGFRKGKVPADMAEKLAGRDKLVQETLQQVVPPAYQAAIQQEKKQPVTYPEFNPVSLNPGEAWVIEAFYAEKPEIKLKDNKKLVQNAIKEADKKIVEAEKEQQKAAKDKKASEKPEQTEFTEEQKKDYRLQHIYQALVQEYQPKIQDLLVKHEVEADAQQLSQQLKQANLQFDDYLQRRGVTSEELSQEMAINALAKLQVAFIMDAIATKNEIKIEEKDIDAYIAEKVDPKMAPQIKQNPDYRRMLANTLMREKIAQHLLSL